MPRLVLAGNNLAAIHTLDLALEALAPDAVLVVAPHPDGRPDWQKSLASHARALGVDCTTPGDVNDPDVTKRVASHDPDLFLSVYYTQLFGPELLEVIGGKALNFHPSLLPLHRGNAPLIWTLVDGDTQTGLSVHHIDSGVDTGPLVLQRTMPIHESDTGHSLHSKMANLVRAAAAELLRDFVAGRPIPAGQPQSGASSYHSVRDPRINHLDWSEPREKIRNIVRALAPPLPGAFSLVRGARVLLARVDPVATPVGASHKAPGMIEVARGQSPLVWAGDGALQLTTVVLDDDLRPGAALVEAGLITEGEVLD